MARAAAARTAALGRKRAAASTGASPLKSQLRWLRLLCLEGPGLPHSRGPIAAASWLARAAARSTAAAPRRPGHARARTVSDESPARLSSTSALPGAGACRLRRRHFLPFSRCLRYGRMRLVRAAHSPSSQTPLHGTAAHPAFLFSRSAETICLRICL
eukprot:COSAG06_NODE_666_length_13272_cov_10.674334_2_plen_158_part_00